MNKDDHLLDKDYGDFESDNDADSDLESKLYAEIYYSTEVTDLTVIPSHYSGISTIAEVKSSWKNATQDNVDTPNQDKVNDQSTNDEISTKEKFPNNFGRKENSENNGVIDQSQDLPRNYTKDDEHLVENNPILQNNKGQTSRCNKRPKRHHQKTRDDDNIADVSVEKELKCSAQRKSEKSESSELHVSTTLSSERDFNQGSGGSGRKTKKRKLTPRNLCTSMNDSVTILEDSDMQDIETFVLQSSFYLPLESGQKRKLRKPDKEMSETMHSSKRKTGLSNIKKSKKGNKQNIQRHSSHDIPYILLATSSDSSMDSTPEVNSKYNIECKNTALSKKNDSVKSEGEEKCRSDISSDSDDSILEVPVPPKPIPPLIVLQDSNTSDKEYDSDSNDSCSCIEPSAKSVKQTTKGQSDVEHPDLTVLPNLNVHNSEVIVCSSESSSLQSKDNFNLIQSNVPLEIHDKLALTERNLKSNRYHIDRCIEDIFVDESSHCSDESINNLILNCTEVQKGAKNLAEIREMGKTGKPNQVSSDDSMTENEATNWGNIAESQIAALGGTTNKENDQISQDENVTEISRKQTEVKQKGKNQAEDMIERPNNETPVNLRDLSRVSSIASQSNTELCMRQGKSIACTENISTNNSEVILINEENASTNERKSENTRSTTVDKRQKSPKKRKSPEDMQGGNKQTRHSNEMGNEINLPQRRSKRIQDRANENYFFQPMTKEMKTFYNDSWGGENFDLAKLRTQMPKDPRQWAILDEDLSYATGRGGRYWGVKKCSLCHFEGHTRAHCPEPRKPPLCYMCGLLGHTSTRCPQTMCLTCGQKQSSYTKTCGSCRKFHCSMCNSIGHTDTACPDLWRRYHQTTDISSVNVPKYAAEVMKPQSRLSCCNCARRGHDSTTCNQYRWSQHFTSPVFVTNYTDGLRYTTNTEVYEVDENICTQDKQPAGKEGHQSFGNEEPIASSSTLIKSSSDDNLKSPSKTNIIAAPEMHSNVLYSCVTRLPTRRRKYYNYTQQLNTEEGVYLAGLQKGHVLPHFLKNLLNLRPFKVEITCVNNSDLFLHIHAHTTILATLKDLIMLWLCRKDDEKNHFVCMDLPTDRQALFQLLKQKLKEIDQNLGDPLKIWEEVQFLKTELKRLQQKDIHNAKRKTYTESLAKLQCRLVMIYSREMERTCGPESDLHAMRKRVERMSEKKGVKKQSEMHFNHYISIVILFNKVFAPHTPPFLENLLQRYSKAEHEEGLQEMSNDKSQNQISKNKHLQLANKSVCEKLIESLNPKSEMHRNVSPTSCSYNIPKEDQNKTLKLNSNRHSAPAASTCKTPSLLEVDTSSYQNLTSNKYQTDVPHNESAYISANYYQPNNSFELSLVSPHNDNSSTDYKSSNKSAFDYNKFHDNNGGFTHPRSRINTVPNYTVSMNPNTAQFQDFTFDDVTLLDARKNEISDSHFIRTPTTTLSTSNRPSVFNISGAQAKININNNFNANSLQQLRKEERMQKRSRREAKAKGINLPISGQETKKHRFANAPKPPKLPKPKLSKDERFLKKVEKAIRVARGFKLHYMKNAALNLQIKLNNKEVKNSDLSELSKLIRRERAHRKLMQKTTKLLK